MSMWIGDTPSLPPKRSRDISCPLEQVGNALTYAVIAKDDNEGIALCADEILGDISPRIRQRADTRQISQREMGK